MAELPAEALFQAGVERFLADVSKGRMPEVVAEPDRLDQILVQRQGPRHGARDRGHLEGVRQARAVMVAQGRHEHLGLVCQTPKRLAVNDPVAIALKRACAARSPPPACCATRRIGARRQRRELALLHARATSAKAAATGSVSFAMLTQPIVAAPAAGPHRRDRGPLRLVAGIRRTCAWCSSVSLIARSTWPSTRSSASGASRSGCANALAMKSWRLLAERERARLASAAHHAARGAREADQVLALAAARARAQLGREARRDQQLQAKRQRARRSRACARRLVEQGSWRQSRLNTPG